MYSRYLPEKKEATHLRALTKKSAQKSRGFACSGSWPTATTAPAIQALATYKTERDPTET